MAVQEEEAIEMERISEEARAARHLVHFEGRVLPTRGGGREAQGLDARFFYLIGVFFYFDYFDQFLLIRRSNGDFFAAQGAAVDQLRYMERFLANTSVLRLRVWQR